MNRARPLVLVGFAACGTRPAAGDGPAGDERRRARRAPRARQAPRHGGSQAQRAPQAGAAGTTSAAGTTERRLTGAAGTAGAAGAGAAKCPADVHGTKLAGLTPVLPSAPPDDTFAQGFSIVEGPVWIGDALFVSQFGSASRPPASRLLKIVPGRPPPRERGPGRQQHGRRRGDLGGRAKGLDRRVSPSAPGASTVVAATYLGKRSTR
jgi:hypothetical protein